MNTIQPIAFFIDAEEKHFDYIESTLKEYKILKYIIAHEKLNSDLQEKPHYHFICDMSLKTYNNLIKKFKLHFQLTGQGHGGKRHYGRIKKIKDLEKLKSYTLKDNNFRTLGYSEDEIQYLFEQSTPKISEKGKLKKMYMAIDKPITPSFDFKYDSCPDIYREDMVKGYYNTIMERIVNYKLDNEEPFTSIALRNQTYKYFQWTKLYSRSEKIHLLTFYNKMR